MDESPGAARLARAMRNIIERVVQVNDSDPGASLHHVQQAAGQLLKHPLYSGLDTYVSSLEQSFLAERQARLAAEARCREAKEKVKSAEALVLLASRSPKREARAEDGLRRKLSILRDHLDDFFNSESIGTSLAPCPPLAARQQRKHRLTPVDELLPAVHLDGGDSGTRAPSLNTQDYFIAEEDEYLSSSEADEADDESGDEFSSESASEDGEIRTLQVNHATTRDDRQIRGMSFAKSISTVTSLSGWVAGVPGRRPLFLEGPSDSGDGLDGPPDHAVTKMQQLDGSGLVSSDKDDGITLIAVHSHASSSVANDLNPPSAADDPDYADDPLNPSSTFSTSSIASQSTNELEGSESSNRRSTTSSSSGTSSKRKRVSPQPSPKRNLGDWRRWNSPRKTAARPCPMPADEPTPRPRAPSPHLPERRPYLMPQQPIPERYTRPYWRLSPAASTSTSASIVTSSTFFPPIPQTKSGTERPPTPQVLSARRASAMERTTFNPSAIFSWRRLSGL